MTVSATLSAHSSKVQAVKMTLSELHDLPKPHALSDYHNPIEHHVLLKTIEERIKEHFDATIEGREIAVGKGKNYGVEVKRNPSNEKWLRHAAIFAVLKLSKKGIAGTRYAIGVRAANDRSMSHQMVAGLNVFVCDNMAFCGDTVILSEKHLKSTDLGAQLDESLKTIKEKFSLLTDGISQLREQKIDDDRAGRLIMEASLKNILSEKCYVAQVWSEWQEPKHDEFKPRTMWSLNNAFTEVMKQLPEHLRMVKTQQLGELMGLGSETKN